MRKLKLIILALALVLPTVMDAEEQKREMRAAWLATVSNIDWPSERGTTASIIARQKQTLIDYLDGFASTNMNAVCIQVRSMCDAMYQSSYEPWSSYLTGTRGTNPGWDPLAFAVEECHKRGIECHAWVNPYRYANGGPGTWNTPQDQALRDSGILLTYTNSSGTTTIDFTHKIVIYDKLVGGCNSAFVPATAYNAAYEGGVIGSVDERASFEDDGGNIKNRIILNLSDLKIEPKRWAVERNADTYEPVLTNGEVTYLLSEAVNDDPTTRHRYLSWHFIIV